MQYPKLPKPSEYKTRKEWKDAAWSRFVKWCATSNSRTLEQILATLTTSRERQRIIKRAVTIERLRAGASYRAIGRELWLTPQTISAAKKASISHAYISEWNRTKKLQHTRRATTRSKHPERPGPKRYRRTKYGRVLMP